MKAVVTGGAGFIGSHIAERLLDDGWEVLVIDSLRTGDACNVPKGADLLWMDVRELTLEKGRSLGAELVVHCAAQTKVTYSDEHPAEDVAMNVGGMVTVMKAFPTSRIVFLSTLGAMFSEQQIAEGPYVAMEPRPPSVYGLSKLLSEHALRAGHENWVALRLSNVFGPRQRSDLEGGVVSIFLERLRKGQPLVVFGDGEQVRDFVHVLDVVDAVMLAASSVWKGKVWHICSGEGLSLLQVLQVMSAVRDFEVQFEPARQELKVVRFEAPVKEEVELGWMPERSLAEYLLEELEEMEDEAVDHEGGSAADEEVQHPVQDVPGGEGEGVRADA